MTKRTGSFLLCLIVSFLAACEKKATGFQLNHRDLTLGSKRLTVEVADTPQAMERGLMFRDHLAENTGMLFVYESPRQASFWMRNTRIPLSIAYVGEDGTILEIYDMSPMSETAVPSKSNKVVFAIEVPQGWFNRAGIQPGTKVTGLPK